VGSIFPVPPMLRLSRSPQSANYTMTAAWQTIYQQTQAYAWIFTSGKINLSNMVAADHIDIRVSTRQVSAGTWIIEDLMDFDDAQPANKQKITIGSIIDTFGVRVEIRQTVGALIQCYCEFSDAIR